MWSFAINDVRGHLFFDARNTTLSPYFALIQPGDKQEVEIANLGPSKIICARHPDEFLCVFASSREQFAKTDAEGSFAIKNLPNGKLKLRFWHPTAGYLLSKKLEKGVMTFEDDSPRFIEITAENQELRESKRE